MNLSNDELMAVVNSIKSTVNATQTGTQTPTSQSSATKLLDSTPASSGQRLFAASMAQSLLRKPASRVLVTGGSGMIGIPFCNALLQEGHNVTILSRQPKATREKLESGTGELATISALGDLDPNSTAFDAVVNLAGEPIGTKRWNSTRIDSFFASRIGTTKRVVEFIESLKPTARPSVLVSASAIGFYGVGMPGRELVTEATDPVERESVSHRLCAAWEAEARAAKALGCRVVTPRIGVVLGRDGGAMAQMFTPFALGLGGPLGSGRQGMSWIHVRDMIRVLAQAINDESLNGAINATAPHPVSNREFASALGRAMSRPAVIPMPALSLKLLMGSPLAEELLLNGLMVGPHRACVACRDEFQIVPAKLQSIGFEFEYPDVDAVQPSSLPHDSR